MTNPTNQDLQAQIEKVDKKVERRHGAVMRALGKVQHQFEEALAPLVKYVNEQETIDQYVKEHPVSEPIRTNGSLNWGKIIELLVQALVASITIIGVLVGTGAVDV